MKKKISVLAVGLSLVVATIFAFIPRGVEAQGAPGACFYSVAECCSTGGNTYCGICAGCMDPPKGDN